MLDLGVMHITFIMQCLESERRKWDGFPGPSLNPHPFLDGKLLVTVKAMHPMFVNFS
jgi:hypothetical protein